eukprot:973587-Pelagomonas_calceolata.AAC.5
MQQVRCTAIRKACSLNRGPRFKQCARHAAWIEVKGAMALCKACKGVSSVYLKRHLSEAANGWMFWGCRLPGLPDRPGRLRANRNCALNSEGRASYALEVNLQESRDHVDL